MVAPHFIFINVMAVNSVYWKTYSTEGEIARIVDLPKYYTYNKLNMGIAGLQKAAAIALLIVGALLGILAMSLWNGLIGFLSAFAAPVQAVGQAGAPASQQQQSHGFINTVKP